MADRNNFSGLSTCCLKFYGSKQVTVIKFVKYHALIKQKLCKNYISGRIKLNIVGL